MQTNTVDLPDYHPESPNYHQFYEQLAEENPEDPRVTRYRREQTFAEKQVSEGQQADQSVDAWCKDMVARAEGQEDEEEPMTNEEIERHFADGTGPFAD